MKNNRNDSEKEDVEQGELYSPEFAIKIETAQKQQQQRTDVGQGELYSPEFAIQVNKQQQQGMMDSSSSTTEVVKKSFVALKDRVMDKLQEAATSFPVPPEHAHALEEASQYLENIVKEMATTAQGLTKEAVHRIKTQLAHIFPPHILSPQHTSKMVDDAEREAADAEEEGVKDADTGHKNTHNQQLQQEKRTRPVMSKI